MIIISYVLNYLLRTTNGHSINETEEATEGNKRMWEKSNVAINKLICMNLEEDLWKYN